MTAIILDDHRNLFRSDADFDQFVALFEGAGESPAATPVWGKKRHLATLFWPADANTHLQDRMLRRIIESPEMLDELRDRLENDEVVD